MNIDLAYSRPKKTAEVLGEFPQDRHRFLQKKVLLTGEQGILDSANGRLTFLYSLRLLVRICPNISVLLPAGQEPLRSEADQLSNRIAFGKAVEFISPGAEQVDHFGAILSVGSTVRPSLPWTAINSNGWTVRTSSGDKALPADSHIDNPIGALAAACLGVGDVFKRLIDLNPARGGLLNDLEFSLRTYQAPPVDCGPKLPERIDAGLLVVGAGAIGNAIVALLSHLPIMGNIHVVDRQRFEDENLGTCILIGPDDVSKPKAQVMERVLREAGKAAWGFEGSFKDYAEGLSETYPAIVLNALDNIDARHEVQRTLWPDMLIDGAIGDFACQVSRHPWAEDVACLICLFQKPTRLSTDLSAVATGLRPSRIEVPDALVTDADVEAAPPEKRDYVRARLGKPICSVVSEAVAQQISLEEQARGFEPSVPFVAAFSACMIMAEAIAYLMGLPSKLEPRFQFDFLLGPSYGQEYPQARRPTCLCQRRKNIDKLRAVHAPRRALRMRQEAGLTNPDSLLTV